MSLSEREQRILAEIERDLAAPELSGRGALRKMRPLPSRLAALAPVRRRRAVRRNAGWLAIMLGGLLAGIALLLAGLALGVPGMAVGGAALTQLSPAVGWLASAFRRRPGDR
jgi:hypothetical protein